MKIIGIPKSDKDSASTRIRFYTFLENLPAGYSWKKYSGKLDGDVLYIQKTVEPWVLKIAKKATIPIVFEIDDIRKDWDNNYDKMFKYASAVITDTETRKELLRKNTDKPIFIIPDCLDYNIKKEDAVIVRDEIKTVTTFGHKGGVAQAIDYMDVPYRKTHISSCREKGVGKFIEWNRKTFLKELKKHDVCILAHKKSVRGDMRSNNRLLVCMAIGLPCIVSDTKEYADTMEDIGSEGLIAKEPGQTASILKEIENMGTREKISRHFREYAFSNFSPATSGINLAEIFRFVYEKREK